LVRGRCSTMDRSNDHRSARQRRCPCRRESRGHIATAAVAGRFRPQGQPKRATHVASRLSTKRALTAGPVVAGQPGDGGTIRPFAVRAEAVVTSRTMSPSNGSLDRSRRRSILAGGGCCVVPYREYAPSLRLAIGAARHRSSTELFNAGSQLKSTFPVLPANTTKGDDPDTNVTR
jgi:hypothetical protein